MLIPSSQRIKSPSVESLMRIWESRYTPDLSSISTAENTAEFRRQLMEATSWSGRSQTASQLTKQVVAIKCQMASLKAKSLYAYFADILNFSDVQHLSDFALLIYLKLGEIYQQPSGHTADVYPPSTFDAVEKFKAQMRPPAINRNDQPPALEAILSMPGASIPPIEAFATALDPLLMDLQQQHMLAKDWHTLGFMTTLLNFSNQLMMQGLSRIEALLLEPYFRFSEEQVAIPWQRVCWAASRHALGSPTFAIVEHCLPQSRDIAEQVYRQLMTSLPHHRSRRGLLSHPEVTHSAIRDLEMKQAYFWLSFLENSLAPIEEELVPLFVMVNPAIGVRWEFMKLANQVLFEAILNRLHPLQAKQVRPYADSYIQAFIARQSDFQRGQLEETSSEFRVRAQARQDRLKQLREKMKADLS